MSCEIFSYICKYTVVLSAKTTEEEFHLLWETTIRDSSLMSDEGLRRHHFMCLLVHLAHQRYRKKYTPAVCLRYMMTWEICRGQINFNPKKFRKDVLYTASITNVLSEHAHALQSLFVKRATSIGDHDSLKPDTGCSVSWKKEKKKKKKESKKKKMNSKRFEKFCNYCIGMLL